MVPAGLIGEGGLTWPASGQAYHAVARALHVAFRYLDIGTNVAKNVSSRERNFSIEADQPMVCPRETFATRRSGPLPRNPRHAHISGEGASEHCTFYLTSFLNVN